jgi:hypothetical protein
VEKWGPVGRSLPKKITAPRHRVNPENGTEARGE